MIREGGKQFVSGEVYVHIAKFLQFQLEVQQKSKDLLLNFELKLRDEFYKPTKRISE